ncbi:hypothetical protein [Croceimicrobium hydrocarbonivorans]|uniref:Uncharacterized protein n=1 Tax=Croceimicrobium hydrocarbonivorans TaxID=2761580 RepID=A0A7H0VHA1_9FLAO|nr:hypothetical protein [Croceimicrobium hydrocarbonivorans]QNR25099.1 hypothetical protein H4K34_04480 [Croceimicrobium hydrocarbonivorans]
MELFKRIIEVVDANLIHSLIPIILILMLIELIFQNRFETKKVLNLIRRTIIIYTIVTFTFYLIGMVMNPDEHVFINRATGSYAWAYWIMLLSALILPLTLFIKKLASRFWYVLLVAFVIKSGMYFERFVIITTSFHRGYQKENGNAGLFESISYGIGIFFLQSIVIVILTLGIFEKKKLGTTLYNKS